MPTRTSALEIQGAAVARRHGFGRGVAPLETETALVRVCCRRCRLASLWTDAPAAFLATVCNAPSRCEAELLEEEFQSAPSRSSTPP